MVLNTTHQRNVKPNHFTFTMLVEIKKINIEYRPRWRNSNQRGIKSMLKYGWTLKTAQQLYIIVYVHLHREQETEVIRRAQRGKELTVQSDNLGLISGMHVVERENSLRIHPPISTCTWWYTCMRAHTHKHNTKNNKKHCRDKSTE